MTIQEFAAKYTDARINGASAPNLVHSQIMRDGFVVLATQAEQFSDIVRGFVRDASALVGSLVPGFVAKDSTPPPKNG